MNTATNKSDHILNQILISLYELMLMQFLSPKLEKNDFSKP